ncbi:hypothetical protein B5S32_g4415 [[Candida] boidinii]|nr:hypothetical protein B5S29_g4275 [[Candida] boidinii]OWB80161.1 hypothetical protein B5S32_g4415 [[Candida] boidinii]
MWILTLPDIESPTNLKENVTRHYLNPLREFVFGRNTSCDFNIALPFVSKQQIVIRFSNGGTTLILEIVGNQKTRINTKVYSSKNEPIELEFNIKDYEENFQLDKDFQNIIDVDIGTKSPRMFSMKIQYKPFVLSFSRSDKKTPKLVQDLAYRGILFTNVNNLVINSKNTHFIHAKKSVSSKLIYALFYGLKIVSLNFLERLFENIDNLRDNFDKYWPDEDLYQIDSKYTPNGNRRLLFKDFTFITINETDYRFLKLIANESRSKIEKYDNLFENNGNGHLKFIESTKSKILDKCMDDKTFLCRFDNGLLDSNLSSIMVSGSDKVDANQIKEEESSMLHKLSNDFNISIVSNENILNCLISCDTEKLINRPNPLKRPYSLDTTTEPSANDKVSEILGSIEPPQLSSIKKRRLNRKRDVKVLNTFDFMDEDLLAEKPKEEPLDNKNSPVSNKNSSEVKEVNDNNEAVSSRETTVEPIDVLSVPSTLGNRFSRKFNRKKKVLDFTDIYADTDINYSQLPKSQSNLKEDTPAGDDYVNTDKPLLNLAKVDGINNEDTNDEEEKDVHKEIKTSETKSEEESVGDVSIIRDVIMSDEVGAVVDEMLDNDSRTDILLKNNGKPTLASKVSSFTKSTAGIGLLETLKRTKEKKLEEIDEELESYHKIINEPNETKKIRDSIRIESISMRDGNSVNNSDSNIRLKINKQRPEWENRKNFKNFKKLHTKTYDQYHRFIDLTPQNIDELLDESNKNNFQNLHSNMEQLYDNEDTIKEHQNLDHAFDSMSLSGSNKYMSSTSTGGTKRSSNTIDSLISGRNFKTRKVTKKKDDIALFVVDSDEDDNNVDQEEDDTPTFRSSRARNTKVNSRLSGSATRHTYVEDDADDEEDGFVPKFKSRR